MFSNSPIAVLNESIFYFGSPYSGLQRSIDNGKSWEMVNVTSNKGGIGNLIVHRENEKGQNTLPIIYGSVGDMVKTTDKGKSWKLFQPICQRIHGMVKISWTLHR